MTFGLFESKIATINDILCAANVLAWDARVMMPSSGVDARGKQMATLLSLARDMATGDSLKAAIEGARRELDGVDATDVRLLAVEQASASITILGRIPARLIAASADLKPRAQAAWATAKANNDFAAFARYFKQTLDLRREMASAIGYEQHPYDALISLYEPTMTWDKLRVIYGELQNAFIPLREKAQQVRTRYDVLQRSYPVDKQKAFSAALVARLGFDFDSGRLDETVHPFEISLTRADVRLASQFRENWLPGGIFSAIHEAGHGMYEQGVAERLTRSIFTTDLLNLYATGGTSYGVHESQSRLWENRVARSRRFWDSHFGELKSYFPDQLADVSVGEFWKAINAARPGFIRRGADELTYDFHIMVRSEIEAGLLDGGIEVNDLPDIWREKVKSYLGVDVPSDKEGFLQDVQWSSGTIGSFPTYTIGNIMSSQLFASATKNASIDESLASADYAPLRNWLHDHIHQHGRSKNLNQLLIDATGEAFSTNAYIADLTRKVDELLA
jgi:carboxypeptidase Taq